MASGRRTSTSRCSSPSPITPRTPPLFAPATAVRWKLETGREFPYSKDVRKFYGTNPTPGDTLEGFVAGATEHKGSWWPNWLDWLHQLDAAEVPAKGKRVPGGKGESALENAPGSYVSMH